MWTAPPSCRPATGWKASQSRMSGALCCSPSRQRAVVLWNVACRLLCSAGDATCGMQASVQRWGCDRGTQTSVQRCGCGLWHAAICAALLENGRSGHAAQAGPRPNTALSTAACKRTQPLLVWVCLQAGDHHTQGLCGQHHGACTAGEEIAARGVLPAQRSDLGLSKPWFASCKRARALRSPPCIGVASVWACRI